MPALHSLPLPALNSIFGSMEDAALPYYAITSKTASETVRRAFGNVAQPFALNIIVSGDNIELKFARRVDWKYLSNWQWFSLMNSATDDSVRGDTTGILKKCFLLLDRCIFAFVDLEFYFHATVGNQQLYEGLLENLVLRNISLAVVDSTMSSGLPENQELLSARAYKHLLMLAPSPEKVKLDHRIWGTVDGGINVQASKSINILSAGWMNLESFLNLVGCEDIRLDVTNQTSTNMCQFLERWMTEAESKTIEAIVGIQNANMEELRGNLRVLDVGAAVQIKGVERTIRENPFGLPSFCIQRSSDGVVARIEIPGDGTVTLVTGPERDLFEPLPEEEHEEEEEEDNFEGEEEAEQEEEEGMDDEEVEDEDEEEEDIEEMEDEGEIEDEEVEEDQMEGSFDDKN